MPPIKNFPPSEVLAGPAGLERSHVVQPERAYYPYINYSKLFRYFAENGSYLHFLRTKNRLPGLFAHDQIPEDYDRRRRSVCGA